MTDQSDAPGVEPSSERAGWRLPAPRPAIAVTLLVVLSGPVLFMGLDRYPVVNADEAFYHDIAWTMLETGDWWTLRTGPGEHVYDSFANAPLQYWSRGLVISLIGPGLFGMRILSACGGLLAVLLAYALGLRVAGRAGGLLAGLLLLFDYQFVYLHGARTGELETGVACLLVGLALMFLRAIEEPRAGFAVHHLLLAALVGWKAPVAPIPLLAELACFALMPAARLRFGAWLRTGLFVAPIALAWHGYQAWRLQAFLPDVIAAVGAQAGGGTAVGGLASRAVYYADRAWFGAWPQIALLPAAIAALAPRAWGAGRREASGVRVVGLYLIAVLVFYCAISKVGPWYVVHAYPFVGVLIATALVDLERRRAIPVGVLLLGAAGVASIPFVAPPLFDFDPFAESAIRIPMPVAARGLGPFPAFVAIGGTAIVVAVAARVAIRRRGSARAVAVSAAVLVLVPATLRVMWPLADLDRSEPAHALAVDLRTRLAAGAPVPFPIDVPPVHPWIAHYYFGHDFMLRAATPRPGDPGPPRQRFTLVARATAASPPRSRAPAAPPPLRD